MSLTMTLQTHTPVLIKESIQALQVQPGKRYIDCTIGSGGHATAILQKSYPQGQLLGIDIDPQAIKTAAEQLSNYRGATTLVNDSFANLENICTQYDFYPVHGILFDLGISSPQLDTAERGFSFQQDGPLDMRFNPNRGLTAADIINTLSENELAQLIRKYGEERHSQRIARAIVQNRPIATTLELAQLVKQPLRDRRRRIHPATRTFLALRIAINHELDNLKAALSQAVKLLDFQARLVVISYHSLEDRIVKQFMKQETRDCICPPEIPVCHCGHVATLKLISKKVITPSHLEIASNPRSRSAKLRVAERIRPK